MRDRRRDRSRGRGSILKEQNPDIQIIGADPVGSLYYEYFKTGHLGAAHSYKVEGVGEDFLPSTMDFSVVDDVIQGRRRQGVVSGRASSRPGRGIVRRRLVRYSVALALQLARELDDPQACVVTILCDSGERYLSKLFNDDWMQENQLLDTPQSDRRPPPPPHLLAPARTGRVRRWSAWPRRHKSVRRSA